MASTNREHDVFDQFNPHLYEHFNSTIDWIKQSRTCLRGVATSVRSVRGFAAVRLAEARRSILIKLEFAVEQAQRELGKWERRHYPTLPPDMRWYVGHPLDEMRGALQDLLATNEAEALTIAADRFRAASPPLGDAFRKLENLMRVCIDTMPPRPIPVARYCGPPLPDAAKPRTPAKKRRRKAKRKPHPLTEKQLEAAQLVGEHKGDIAAAARAAGKSRTAMRNLYHKAMRKLGRKAIQHATQALPTDKRGQINVADEEEE
jgi:hypothetical protein